MSRTSIVKGSLTLIDYGLTQPFMFNPTTITDTKSAEWGTTAVPHISSPVHQFGAGGERLISFDLYLDGDRGRILTGGGFRGRIPNDPGLDVAPWIKFYRSLLYPSGLAGFDAPSSTIGPPEYWIAKPPTKVVFNYGTLWQDVICVVKKVDIQPSMFGPNGEVIRATLPITLAESPPVPQYSFDIFVPPVG